MEKQRRRHCSKNKNRPIGGPGLLVESTALAGDDVKSAQRWDQIFSKRIPVVFVVCVSVCVTQSLCVEW